VQTVTKGKALLTTTTGALPRAVGERLIR